MDVQQKEIKIINSDSCYILEIGTIIFHKKNINIMYDWFSYVPTKISKQEITYIWIIGLHGNYVTDKYNEITAESRDKAIGLVKWAEKNNFIMCVPVIPRPRTNYIYTIAFPTKVFEDTTDLFCKRPDLKVNLMIDKLTSELRQDGYLISDKILMYGHSAGAMFVQRYSLLYPKRVLVIVAGQCGGAITLPIKNYKSVKLNWPVGINDFKTLTGNDFDFKSYKEIKQLFYIGEMDSTNSTLVRTGELWNDHSQIDFLKNIFGITDPIRIEKQTEYLVNLDYSITFIKYAKIGHQKTRQIFEDLCKICIIEQGKPWPTPRKIRPCGESFGIDVYKIARNLGLPCQLLKSKEATRNWDGFVLIA